MYIYIYIYVFIRTCIYVHIHTSCCKGPSVGSLSTCPAEFCGFPNFPLWSRTTWLHRLQDIGTEGQRPEWFFMRPQLRCGQVLFVAEPQFQVRMQKESLSSLPFRKLEWNCPCPRKPIWKIKKILDVSTGSPPLDIRSAHKKMYTFVCSYLNICVYVYIYIYTYTCTYYTYVYIWIY